MGKTLFKETVLNPGFRRPQVSDSVSNDGKTWIVPIWNLGERNLNGRTYTEELAKRIVKENADKLCNDGHLEIGEYANAMAHAFDPFIENGQLLVHFEFIDEAYEKKIIFCLEHDIPVGVSSVGYGEMDEHGVIDPDTYELVRYFDFVSMPANETYVTKDSVEPEDNGDRQDEKVDDKRADESADESEPAAADLKRRLLVLYTINR